MLREKMPAELLPTAAIRSVRPIACSALTPCGLVLMPAPTSVSVAERSNTSASIPRLASAFAVARPPNPPPIIATVRICVIRPSRPSSSRPQRNGVALIDDRVAVDLGLQHGLRFVPGDLVENICLIEPTLGIHIDQPELDLLRRLAEIFREQIQNLRAPRSQAEGAVRANKSCDIVATTFGDRPQRAVNEFGP